MASLLIVIFLLLTAVIHVLAAVIVNFAVVVEFSTVVAFSKLELVVVELLVMLISRFHVGYKLVSKSTQEIGGGGALYSAGGLITLGDNLLRDSPHKVRRLFSGPKERDL